MIGESTSSRLESVMQVSIWPVTIGPQANSWVTNFFLKNSRSGDNFSVQNSGPRIEKGKQNPHPRA